MLNIYITIALLGLNLLFPKSKQFSFLLFLFMWTLWGWNTWNGDYDGYQLFFEDPEIKAGEIGFSLYNYAIKSLGFSFQGFMAITAGLLLFFVWRLLLRYTSYPGLLSVVYFIVFLQGFVYIRNYFLWVIIAWGLISAIENKRGRLKYVFLTLISSTFHSSGILYLGLLLGITKKRINARKMILYSMILFVSVFLLFNVFTFIINRTSFASSLSYYGDGIYFGTSIIFHFALVLLFIYIDFKFKNISLTEKERDVMTLIYNFNILSLFLLSFYLIIPYMANRFVCFFVFINLFYLSSIIKYSFNKKRLRKFSTMYFGVLLLTAVAMVYVSTLPYTVIPLYMCNMIWGDDYSLHNLNIIDRL